MAAVAKISEPVGIQTPDVHEWRRSLRSPSPSGGMLNTLLQTVPTLRSRTPSPNVQVRTSLGSRSPSPSRITTVKHSKGFLLTDGQSASKKPSVSSMLRKSTGNMSDVNISSQGSKSSELANIEVEYIRNLQQQVYFLELEANYLREQARKATDMHPHMVQEAESMVSKLHKMQAEADGMVVEIHRKDSKINIITTEKERIESHLREEKAARAKDKRLFMNEIVTLKTGKDRLEQEVNRKDSQLLEAKSEIDKSAIALKNAETRIQTLKTQIRHHTSGHIVLNPPIKVAIVYPYAQAKTGQSTPGISKGKRYLVQLQCFTKKKKEKLQLPQIGLNPSLSLYLKGGIQAVRDSEVYVKFGPGEAN